MGIPLREAAHLIECVDRGLSDVIQQKELVAKRAKDLKAKAMLANKNEETRRAEFVQGMIPSPSRT